MTYPRPLSWINTLSIDRKSADIDCTSNFIHSGLTEHRNAVCQIKAALIPVEITHRLASITLHNLPAILTRTFSLTLPFPTYISVCSILQTNFIICTIMQCCCYFSSQTNFQGPPGLASLKVKLHCLHGSVTAVQCNFSTFFPDPEFARNAQPSFWHFKAMAVLTVSICVSESYTCVLDFCTRFPFFFNPFVQK